MKKKLHKLLLRQLQRLELTPETLPSSQEAWEQFLLSLSRAYVDADQDRYLLERSLQISSEEMRSRWQSLVAMEERWRSLGECAPDLILMVDAIGVITFANRGREKLTKEELIGLPLVQLYSKVEMSSAEESLRETLSDGKSRHLVIESEGRDDSVWYSLRMSAVVKGDQVAGAVVVESDITEVRQLEMHVEAEKERTAHASKFATLGVMAGSIAHEINSPLCTIQLLAGMLRDNMSTSAAAPEQVLAASLQIDTTVERISKIVHGLKTFARNADGDPYCEVPVTVAIDDALNLIGEKLRMDSIEVRVLPYSPDLKIDCRVTQISQVLMNLFNNAQDAVQSIEKKWIGIEVIDQDMSVAIAISDGGAGVPQEIAEKIMDPFFTTKGPGKGTGLGLSISRGIVAAHNGLLYLDGTANHTRFVVVLPKKQPVKNVA